MKKQGWFFCILFLFLGCAAPGQKFISITYIADHEKTQTGLIGMAPFQDLRKDINGGYVGYRLLMDKSQETYFVQGMNLADTLKKAVGNYYEKNGFNTTPMDPWELSTDGVMAVAGGFDRIVTGQINAFECRAKKKGGTTQMVLDIDLTLFLGDPEKNSLKTMPVALTLERTDLTFTPEKLEQFVNQALEEIIQKTLTF